MRWPFLGIYSFLYQQFRFVGTNMCPLFWVISPIDLTNILRDEVRENFFPIFFTQLADNAAIFIDKFQETWNVQGERVQRQQMLLKGYDPTAGFTWNHFWKIKEYVQFSLTQQYVSKQEKKLCPKKKKKKKKRISIQKNTRTINENDIFPFFWLLLRKHFKRYIVIVLKCVN